MSLELFERSLVLIDASSVVVSGFDKLMEVRYPLLKESKKQFLLPKGSLRELQDNAGGRFTAPETDKAEKNIRYLIANNLFRYFGEEVDSCAEAILKHAVIHRKMPGGITVITQNAKLASDLVALNSCRSVGKDAPDILVRRLTADGIPEEFRRPPRPAATPPLQKEPATANDLLDKAFSAYLHQLNR